MKEHGILFNADMVRAILGGRKTQTRRMVKPQPVPFGEDSPFTQATLKEHVGKPWMPVGGVFQESWQKPLGTVGDRLWVRETWAAHDAFALQVKDSSRLYYRADDPKVYESDNTWTPSIHMPRWASRITLEITAVRVERLQEITGQDCIAEGIKPFKRNLQGASITTFENYLSVETDAAATASFRTLWSSIYGGGSWDANPWVWVYEFRRNQCP